MQRLLLFDTSPLFILLCLGCAFGGAWLMYRQPHAWNATWNKILFAVRFFLLFFIALLLMGPIVKQLQRVYQKPLYILLRDNSSSVNQATTETERSEVTSQLNQREAQLSENGFETHRFDLRGEQDTSLAFNYPNSNLYGALKKIGAQYEGRRIEGVLLVSDGIYNSGLSPLYADYPFPVSSIGVGDTVVRPDIAVHNVIYNKIAYQGDRFPLRVEVTVNGYNNVPLSVNVMHKGTVIEYQTVQTGTARFVAVDFHPQADEAGLQRYEIVVEPLSDEFNKSNNRTAVFVDVVEGRKKIILIAAAPHPDVKAFRAVVEKNPNYEFILHIPAVHEAKPGDLDPTAVDLAILYQVPDLGGKTASLFRRYVASRTSLLVILGRRSDLDELGRSRIPLTFDATPRQFDDVTPIVNTAFSHFAVAEATRDVFSTFPPATVHFGKVPVRISASPLLFQKVGNVETTKPLLAVDMQDDRKMGFLLGEGIWKWRMDDFLSNADTNGFDDLFGKLIQYLATTDERQKFKCYPVRKSFSNAEPVVFESQVYNDVYEPIDGQLIRIAITDEKGTGTDYEYTTGAGDGRYDIGAMAEGVYRYEGSTELSGKEEKVSGEFLVVGQQIEMQNLTADFGLLRRLAHQTGGTFYKSTDMSTLNAAFEKMQARPLVHAEETFASLINIQSLFWLLLALVSLEWFVRKYFGGY